MPFFCRLNLVSTEENVNDHYVTVRSVQCIRYEGRQTLCWYRRGKDLSSHGYTKIEDHNEVISPLVPFHSSPPENLFACLMVPDAIGEA